MSDLVEVTEQVQPFSVAAGDLNSQVSRVIIDSNDVQANAGDLMKIINNQINKQDDARTLLVKPLNDHVKMINGQFKPHMDMLKSAKSGLKAKMDIWAGLEVKRIRDEESETKRLAEEALLERAAENEEKGNSEGAEALLDVAEQVTTQAPAKAPIQRGNLGSSVSTRSTWDAEVVDLMLLVQAVAKGDMPIDAIQANEKWLKDFSTKKKVEKTNFGVRLFEKFSSVTR